MKTFEELKIKSTLKEKVLFCLEKNIDARNSDIDLSIMIWRLFYDAISNLEDSWGCSYECIKLNDMNRIPLESEIKRVRASIQNKEHRYLPTLKRVLKNRKIWEQKWYQESFNNFNEI